MKIAASVIVLGLLLATNWAHAAPPPEKEAPGKAYKANLEPATMPFPKAGPQAASWMKRHESFNARAKQGGVDLVFLGDSITQQWEDVGKEVWEKYYAKRNAAMMGISGDRTQHVLWRIANGNLDGIAPKVAVIMIGTNNTKGSEYTAEDIARGIGLIVKGVREKTPHTKILLLAIFPRGEKPGDAGRVKAIKVNQAIAKLDDGKNVFFLDIAPKLMNADGSLSKEIFHDYLHLTPKGYLLWAEAIEPKLSQLMK